MKSIILSSATRLLMPLMLLFSLFAFFRGHNEPGGGFIGGLIAASAFSLYAVAEGVEQARRVLRIDPRTLLGIGLLVGLISGLPSVFKSKAFMTGVWMEQTIPGLGKAGTPLLFDLGVFLVVVGFVLTVVFSLAES
ncbi:MAG: Na+/H+ antiporter subunit B [Fimbriimonadales bacterium]|nr:Na+/H+ antiporter subunit B [Fimbriimonadales bacterium]